MITLQQFFGLEILHNIALWVTVQPLRHRRDMNHKALSKKEESIAEEL